MHARPSIIQVGCPISCYKMCALDHAKRGTADLAHPQSPTIVMFYKWRLGFLLTCDVKCDSEINHAIFVR